MAKTKNKKMTMEDALVPAEEQPYEVPDNWCWTYLPVVCTSPITDGTHKTPTYCKSDEGVPFISAKDVTKGYIDWDNIKYITPELHDELYARLAPQKDDILLAKNGTTGIAALVEDDRIFDIYVTLAVLRPNRNIILPRYLHSLVNSPVMKKQFDSHLTGIGVPNLHLRDIQRTVIPLPSLSEQERIVKIIDDLFIKLDEAQEKIEYVLGDVNRNAMLGKLKLMRQSILSKAFRGNLGTHNDNDEIAIDVLRKALEQG